ncbi:hypothetical protein CAP31_07740 [Sulfuriferula sp. AH1]|uniref:hypothetical protein n=1 Tax=Sulfuriferula sp. AH1 TaxID=1985873 RepID=UPI000B3B24B8|nr:hypothetical protein [Sulfuriferula sp. AH1]ARU31586.1 hypothetical protein CAP31_07740 [Sulfuriferula sp. AH1]
MALDAIAEIVIRVIGQFVAEVLFVGIFYWPGWVILRVLTLGRYPPPQEHPHNREFVAIVAFAALLVGLTLYFSGAFA